MVALRKEADMEGYSTSLAHLVDEIQRLDLIIRLQVQQVKRKIPATTHEFRGLYIAEEEIDALLAVSKPWEPAQEPVPPELIPLLEARQTLEEHITTRKAISERAGTELRLERLRHWFGLSAFDVDVLLLCLAPELDLGYEKLYAYLQDDLTKKWPSVNLLLDLLCPTFEAKLAARQRLLPGAPLRRHELLQLLHDPAQLQPPLLSHVGKVDARIVHYLLGLDDLDPRLSSYARCVGPQARLEELCLPEALGSRLQQLALEIRGRDTPLVLYFQGAYGAGKQTTAEAFCRMLGTGLLVVEGERLLGHDAEGFAAIVRLLAREALLQRAALYWSNFDALLADDKRPWREALLRMLEVRQGVTLLSAGTLWEPADALRSVPFLRFEFPPAGYSERLELWKSALNGTVPSTPDLDLELLANTFRFSAGQIRDAVANARNLAQRRPAATVVTMPDLMAACRLQSNRNLAILAHQVTPHYGWNDIILPADRVQQLREISHAVQYRSRVYDTWGFDRQLSLGKGLGILFAGASGTGKTMAAEVLAGALGLDLYKIDLATVVSKYIGETEKNLARIFAEAETANAILFFDEADALFGKRSEVRDAHDRYANIEIGYLLQRMEAYEGVVILATNLRKNMDDAFVRRLAFIVEFPLPNVEDRRRIWEGVWPPDTPRSPDLDLDLLARRFELAGGNIRNIALAAAFLAAANGAVVSMAHVMHAIRREYQKMGRVLVAEEWGTAPG
jgi:ATP-dependent 26S proteasome regulatory subunit